jgi:hypothetical protein
MIGFLQAQEIIIEKAGRKDAAIFFEKPEADVDGLGNVVFDNDPATEQQTIEFAKWLVD